MMKFKKLFLIICTLCLSLSLALGLSACFGGGKGGEKETVPVTSVGLNKTSLELDVGDTFTLSATVMPDNATNKTVEWASSDTSVATVANGLVTAIKSGKADITASAGDKKATCSVTVKTTGGEPSGEKVSVESVTLSKTSLSLEVDKTFTLNANVKPENATNKTVTWSSSDDAVATVVNGLVTAKSVGNATITATADGKSATCSVETCMKSDCELPVTEITLNKTDLELKVGETFTLTAKVAPDNATDGEVVWSSSNDNVATVVNGLVTAKAVGTAKITAKAGDVTAVCEVGVVAKDITPPDTPDKPDVPVIPDGSLITYAHAGEESAAFEWKETNAAGAKVEYKLSSASSYTSVDKQLIRGISATCARVDVLGLKGGAKYDFKITSSDNKSATVANVTISALDRSGYAHFNYTKGVGAYNDDGTLKSGAKVIYVTEANKNNIDGSGTSIAEYLSSKAKNEKNPIVVRIIGTVGAATWKKNNVAYTKTDSNTDSSGNLKPEAIIGANGKALAKQKWTQADLVAGGYNVLDTSVYSELEGLSSTIKWDSSKNEFDSCWNDCQVNSVNNITVEGVGEDAEIFQWGLTFKSCNSVEVRNIRFYDYTEDACSFEGSENSETLSGFKHKNFWVHHNTFDIGVNYWDVCKEQDKHDGDGSTDFKYLAYVTIAYNRYNGTHKTGLVGGGDSAHQACFTFHHNYYNECDQRMPLGRQANMHIYNNYFYKSGLYSISLRAGAYAFVENCVFTSSTKNTKPIELVKGSNGTPSAKVIDCDLGGKSVTNGVGSANLYVGSDRTKTVEGGNLYGLNFEQDAGFYTVTNKLNTSEVATAIPKLAGVVKRGSNITIEGGSEEVDPPEVTPDPPVETPDTPTGGQSVSYTQEGETVAVDGTVSDGTLFTAIWNGLTATEGKFASASVKQGVSAAVAGDKTFAYALVSNGSGGGITVTAKKAITLTIYYGASDSKFVELDQEKSGNLIWTIDGGAAVTSKQTGNKSNKIAYSESIELKAGQVIVFTISANRFVLYGLFAEQA